MADSQCGVSRVFVLDRKGQPMMPCHPARARKLLQKGRAKVHRLIPFTIRIIDRVIEESTTQPVRLKLDPGYNVTGIALVRQDGDIQHVLHLAELHHRGHVVRKRLRQRAGRRRRRRFARCRHRRWRGYNRRNKYNKVSKWLPPSLLSRVYNTTNWAALYRKFLPVAAIDIEATRFDTQKLQNPEITGVEYQQGTLYGYETREYLLEKWGRQCAYCDVDNVPLQIDHIVPKAAGGSNRVSNLTLACVRCNQAKGAQSIDQFLADDPKRLAVIKRQTKKSLSAAAYMNSARDVLTRALGETGLPIAPSTGGYTKYNRSRLGIPKTHALDASCVGGLGSVGGWRQNVLTIKAVGRGSYQRTLCDKFGFPRGYYMRHKKVHGFQSGDQVSVTVPRGKHKGTHRGSAVVRATGRFDISTSTGRRAGIGWSYFSLLQRAAGYSFAFSKAPVVEGSH